MVQQKDVQAEAQRMMDEMRNVTETDPQRGLEMALECKKMLEEAGDVDGAEDAFRLVLSATITGGDIEEAVEMAWDRLDAAQKSGNAHLEAHAHSSLSEVFLVLGDAPQVIEQGEIARKIFDSLGKKKWVAKSLANIAMGYLQGQECHKGEQIARQALKAYQEIGDKEGEATSYHIVHSSRSMGAKGDVMEPLEKALALYRELGWTRHEGIMLYNLAEIKRSGMGEASNQDLALAQRSAEEAMERWRSVGNYKGEANAIHSLGKVLKQRGLEADGVRMIQDRYDELRSAGDKRGQMLIAWSSIEIMLMCGTVAQALALAEQCLAITRSIGDRHEEAVILDQVAKVRTNRGELDDALQCAQEALAIFQELGDKGGETIAMKTLTVIYTARNEPYKAPNRSECLDHLGELAMAVQKKDKAKFKYALTRIQDGQGVDNQDFGASLGPLLEDPETYKWFTEATAEFFGVSMEEAEDMSRGAVKAIQRAKCFDARGFAGGTVYAAFRYGMMGYGPSFRPIQALCRQGRPMETEPVDGCYALAVMKDDTLEEWERSALLQAHAGVLDGALQVTSALHQGQAEFQDQIVSEYRKSTGLLPDTPGDTLHRGLWDRD
eukprot:TRINITY_DN8106_c0_g1_i2.p1 TRINITY_DN8106_c0_g1~~TRINITY_DN8106_c0_g1_i2.p1  ORF type:complete len:608 (-),score=116.35 TRINITY_DN8106_c0_g1_i2:68-1891(-)